MMAALPQRQPGTQLPPEVEAEVVRLYQTGAKREAIATAVGCGMTTLSSILNRNGVELRGQQKTVVPSEIEVEVIRLYKAGTERKAITEQTGVPQSTITVVLRRNGIDLVRNRPALPEDVIEAVRKLYLDNGRSQKEIAVTLGLSTGTVAGIVHRRKWKRPEEINKANLLRARQENGQKAQYNLALGRVVGVKRPRTAAPPSAFKIGVTGHVYTMPPTAALPKFTGATPDSNPKPWINRLSGECTWPVSGEGADTFSCCAPVVPGTSWCEGHCRTGHYRWAGKGYSAKPERFTTEIVRRYA